MSTFYPFPYVLYRCTARGQPFPVWDILNSKNCSISCELRDQYSIDRSVKSSNLVIELFHIIKVMGCYCSHVLSGKKKLRLLFLCVWTGIVYIVYTYVVLAAAPEFRAQENPPKVTYTNRHLLEFLFLELATLGSERLAFNLNPGCPRKRFGIGMGG